MVKPAFLLDAMVLIDGLQEVLVPRKMEVTADGLHFIQGFIIKGNADKFHSEGKVRAFCESAQCTAKALQLYRSDFSSTSPTP
jgi:hypothetical protein